MSHARGSANGSRETLKDAGNRAFTAGDYPAAIEHFTAAIDLLSLAPDSGLAAAAAEAGVDARSLHLLYSNRSATYAASRMFQEALDDADRVIQLKPEWAKGYFRRGSALEGLLMFAEAASAYQAGVSLDPTDAALRRCADESTALLQELRLSEAQMTKSANPEADRFDLLVKWLKEGGSKFPRLYLQYYSEDYRGVHCLSRIPEGEVILYVPYHMVMTSQVALESPIGKAIFDAAIELRSKHSYLAAYLLQERAKGADSFWAPYINSLPRVYGNMPIFFGPDLLAELKGSFTLAKISDRIESLRAEYDNICAHVPALRAFTHDEFVWARLAVITRIFGLTIRGVKTDGLVAYADMLNHKRPRDSADTDTRWQFDDQMNGFTITTLRDIQRGEQVYDSYGRKCNSRFFVNYGFALDDNEDDNEALLRVSCPPDAPCLSLKNRLAGQRNQLLSLKEFQVPASYRETNDREKKGRELFSWLRLCHANEAELMQIQSLYSTAAVKGSGAPEVDVTGIDPVSSRLETVVLAHVKRAAQDALAAFPTTLEQDDALLAANKFANSNVRNCVVQRRGEKIVLRFWVNLADTAIPLLALKWADLRKHAHKYIDASSLSHYITQNVATLVKQGA